MNPDNRTLHAWTAEEKAQAIVAASGLDGDQLTAYLSRACIPVDQFVCWRQDLQGEGRDIDATQRIRTLEREVEHKERALSEIAALLALREAITGQHQGVVVDFDEPIGK